MDRIKAKKTLKEGTVRQKIVLLFNGMAADALGEFTAAHYGAPDEYAQFILTPEEHDKVLESITSDKDIRYYEKLRQLNTTFNYFRGQYLNYKQWSSHFERSINDSLIEPTLLMDIADTATDIIDLIEDKETRTKAIELVLSKHESNGVVKRSIGSNSYILQTNDAAKAGLLRGKDRYFKLDLEGYLRKESIDMIILTAAKLKLHLEMFKAVLKKDFPIYVYRKWVKTEELNLSKSIELLRERTIDNEFYPEDYPYIPKYEEIEVEITKEMINDFKSNEL
jgi:hypothetical protein